MSAVGHCCTRNLYFVFYVGNCCAIFARSAKFIPTLVEHDANFGGQMFEHVLSTWGIQRCESSKFAHLTDLHHAFLLHAPGTVF